MSIKTSKRIALGVIAGLVFAPFAAIAPASANAGAYTANSAVTNTGATGTGAAATPIASGTALTANLLLTTAAATVAGNTVGITYNVTAGPAAFDITATCTFTSTAANLGATGAITNTGGVFVVSYTGINAGALVAVNIGTVSCPTTIGGTYTITPTEAAVPVKAGFAAATLTPQSAIVSGLNVSQGLTRSTTAGSAVSGGAANVIFTAPIRAAAAQIFTVTTSGVGSIQAVTDGANATVTTVNGSAADFSAGARVRSTAVDTTTLVVANIALAAPAAGVQTISIFSTDAVTGVQTLFRTATVTWGGTLAASTQFSTSIIAAGNAVAAAADALNVSLVRTAGGLAANITVTVRDQNGNPLASGLTATVSGPGLLSITPLNVQTGAAGTGRAISLTAAEIAGNADGISNVSVFADGTAGVATITISSGTLTLGTETVTFFGTVATLEATQNYAVARASATGQTLGSTATNLLTVAAATNTRPAVVIVAKDSNGAVVPNLTITGVSSDANVISSAAVAQADGTLLSTGAAGPGTYLASVTSAVGGTSGATATVTFRTPNPAAAGTFISAAPLTFTLGGGVVTETLTFGKATYLPGEAVVVTRTAKDASGNPVFDFAAAPAVSFNKALGGDAIGASFYVGGVRATSATAPTVFAPVTFGEFTARMTSGNTAATVITATASVPAPVAPVAPVVEAPLDKPTLTVVRDGRNNILSGTAVDGEGDIIVYVKRVGTTAWKERAKTLEVAAPGDFNGTIRAPKNNVLIRVKQEGTGLFSNQVVVLK